MWFCLILIGFFAKIHQISCTNPEIEEEEFRAQYFLEYLNNQTIDYNNKIELARWEYSTNITDYNLKKQLNVTKDVAEKEKENWKTVITYNWQAFRDYDLKRQFKHYSKLGSSALPDEKLLKYEKILGEMLKIYSTASICDFHQPEMCNLTNDGELMQLFAKSRDAAELRHLWLGWRDAVGPQSKPLFREYVDLLNEAARLNNFTDAAEMWIDAYEDGRFREQVAHLWRQIRPFYLQIHAYVRHHLRRLYGDVVPEAGPIPAHLLGNMYAQTWRNVAEAALPYPEAAQADLGDELRRQNYTTTKMFLAAEDFFKSINMSTMPPSFWRMSVLEQIDGREMDCHASAWDFYGGDDFRIKMCTTITLEDFFVVHHEMGHVQYFIHYKDLPAAYRSGANNGFHEAVGDVISLSVMSRKHLAKLGLIQSKDDDGNENKLLLNNLFNIALEKVVFLPFAYVVDLWRWDVFAGRTGPETYNCEWWALRERYQGVRAPANRTERDFDPAAKYHIIASVPYIRYFVSHIVQFQFHRALCEKAGQYYADDPARPLHNCDIYQSKEAGNAFKKMLSMGSRRPWPDALEALTGQRSMDAAGLLEFFRPLIRWLEQENKRLNVPVGWESSSDNDCLK